MPRQSTRPHSPDDGPGRPSDGSERSSCPRARRPASHPRSRAKTRARPR
jgi:hypothetical protein